MDQSDAFVLLGKIVSAHALRGEVKIVSYTENPTDIATYGPLTDERGENPLRLTLTGGAGDTRIARIDGVSTREAAEKLKGRGLYVSRAQLPDGPEGAFYHEDLIGMRIVNTDGAQVGEVVAVHNFGAGDILEFRRDGSTVTEMLPFAASFFPEIALESRIITLDDPEIIEARKDKDE